MTDSSAVSAGSRENPFPADWRSRAGWIALAAYVEENAYRQYMAMQIGEPYVFSEAEQKASREKLWTPSLFKKTWDHYRSKID